MINGEKGLMKDELRKMIKRFFDTSFGIFRLIRHSRSSSFGLIEVLVSGIVLVTVIGASVSVRQRAGAEAAFARHQSEAYMLAQEGIEAVRQIRDTNYLAKQKVLAADPFTRRPWTCGLTSSTSFGTEVNGTDTYQSCGADGFNTANVEGDFSLSNPKTYRSLELGNGMIGGTVFRDDAPATFGTVLRLPSWNLSSNGNVPPFDAGTPAGNPAVLNMDADNCKGAERIFVHEGTAAAASSNVLMNRRSPAYDPDPVNKQENYLGPSGPGTSCTANGKAGYFEFKRQVFVTNRLNDSASAARNTNEVPGNLPAAWNVAATDISNHELQVLVRVSWQESNRASGTGDENAVLLATYVTDWRPSN